MRYLTSAFLLAVLMTGACSDKSVESTGQEPLPQGIPKISAASSGGGWIGDSLRIFGESFGDSNYANHSIIIGNVDMPVHSWSDVLIRTIIPEGAQSGDIHVVVDTLESNPFDFVVCRFDSVVPTIGGAGTEIQIHGAGFIVADKSVRIFLGQVEAEVSAVADTLITATVPGGAGVGHFNLKVSIGVHTTTVGTFEISSDVLLQSIYPKNGPWGTVLTLTGSEFGEDEQSGSVSIGDTRLDIINWSSAEIQARILAGTVSGNLSVTVDSLVSNAIFFRTLGISKLVPQNGYFGDTVQIIGKGFADSLGVGSVILGGQFPEVLSRNDSLVTVIVPENAASGEVLVTADEITSNIATFEYSPPELSAINPDWGPVQTVVTIVGARLGRFGTTGKVQFSGTEEAAEILSWSHTEIVAVVPQTAHFGDVYVEVRDQETNRVNFDVFRVNHVSSEYLHEGEIIDVYGESFGETQGSSEVTLGSQLLPIDSWSDTLISATIPIGAQAGELAVRVNGISLTVGELDVTYDPQLFSIDPDFGTFGTEVTLTGQHFGSDASEGRVLFNSTEGNIISWSDQEIVVEMPFNSTTGNVLVEVRGYASNAVPFSVFGITDLHPGYTEYGDTVTIVGTGFGESQGANYVAVDDAIPQVPDWSNTSIAFIVPDVIDSGVVTVTMNGVESNSDRISIISEVGLLGLLQETRTVSASYKGYFTFETHIYGYIPEEVWDTSYYCTTVSAGNSLAQPLEWDGAVFGAYYEWGDQYPPGSGSSYVVLGTISADGRSIISFGGGSHYWSDTAHNVYHEHKRLEAGDMELDSVDFEQGIFQFKISGPSVEYHSPVAGYQTYERDLFYTEQDHGIVGQTFDNPDCEPVIIVTFRK